MLTWHRGRYCMDKPRSWMRGYNSKESIIEIFAKMCQILSKKSKKKKKMLGIRFSLLPSVIRVHTYG